MKRLFSIWLVVAIALTTHAWGQGGAVVARPWVVNRDGAPVAGAKVYVCNHPAVGMPCSNLASLYSDPALAPMNAIANPIVTPYLGNYGYYTTPGWYDEQICFAGVCKQYSNMMVVSASQDLSAPGPIGGTTPNTGAFTVVTAGDGTAAAPSFAFASSPGTGWYSWGTGKHAWTISGTPVMALSAGAPGLALRYNYGLNWTSNSDATVATYDLSLLRDAANVLACRMGLSACTVRIYNSWANGGTDYERAYITYSSANSQFQVGTESGGTGTARCMGIVPNGNKYQFCNTQMIIPTGNGIAFGGADAGISRPAAGVICADGASLGDCAGIFKATNFRLKTFTGSKCIHTDASGNMIEAAADCGTSSGLGDPGSNGLVKRTALNTTTAAVSGTDYAPATSGSSILKGNGAGGFSAATQSDARTLLGTGGVRTTEASAGLTTEARTKNIPGPLATDKILLWESSIAVTFTNVQCQTDVGTVTFNLEKRAWGSFGSVGTAMLSANYTASTSSAAATTFSSAAVAAHTPVFLIASATASAPTWMWCSYEFTKDSGQ